MFKKVGIVTVGVTAGLMAAAPFASAGEAPQNDHHDRHASSDCDFTGGTGEGSRGGDANGDLAGIAGAAVGGIGGNNIGNIADCSSFLNDNLNGNSVLSGNKIGL